MKNKAVPIVMSVRELSEVLNVGINNAYALVRSGVIPSVRVGRIYRITQTAVENFLNGGI